MDRGRVGNDKCANKAVWEKAKQIRLKYDEDRMNQIKYRKPGSGTIKNKIPLTYSSQNYNPRGQRIKDELNLAIEHNNRFYNLY